jgi:hypothetical protein
VLTWPTTTKVFVCTRATDMRCGFDTLAAQVTRFLAQDPLSGHLFVFRSRKGDRARSCTGTPTGTPSGVNAWSAGRSGCRRWTRIPPRVRTGWR